MATKEELAKAWPYPVGVVQVPPGGEWGPPTRVEDVAILIPSKTGNPGIHAWKDYPCFVVAGLDGKYILSSDGSTRPYGEGH